ncbi:MAG: hypothetical protein WCH34_11730 [Bacteroidota bacterium]
MKLIYYNRGGSAVDLFNESISILMNIIVADHVKYDSIYAYRLLHYINLEHYTDELVYEVYSRINKDDKQALDLVAKAKYLHPYYKKALKIKHKNKEDLAFIARTRNILAHFKLEIKQDMEERLKDYNIRLMIPFVDAKIFKQDPSNYNTLEETEHIYIEKIAKTFIEKESIFAIDFVVDCILSKSLVDSHEGAPTHFIDIPMWFFPSFMYLNYEEVKFIRDDLQPKLASFKADFKALADELFHIPYLPETIEQIKELCRGRILHHIKPIEEAMDENIYMCKAKKSFFDKTGVTFRLGVTSADIIIGYFECAKIILPYMANEIRLQVQRHMDINASFLFTTYRIESGALKGTEFRDFKEIEEE